MLNVRFSLDPLPVFRGAFWAFSLWLLFPLGEACAGSPDGVPLPADLTAELGRDRPIAAFPDALKTSERICVPFDLEKEGTVLAVPFMNQYYANCYAAGAAGQISAWLISKRNSRDFQPVSRTCEADRTPEEMLWASNLAISPQHLSVSYALHQKDRDFDRLKLRDWTHTKPPATASDRAVYLNHLRSMKRPESELQELRDIVHRRIHYFEKHGGNSNRAILHLAKHPVCPVAMVEQRFGDKVKGTAFFREMRLAYLDFAEGIRSEYIGLQPDYRAVMKAEKRLRAAYEAARIPSEGRLSGAEIFGALVPGGEVVRTDPLHWVNEVLLGLCRRSPTHPPVMLNALYSVKGMKLAQYPRPQSVESTDPLRARTFIERYFGEHRGHASTNEVQPLGISYSGHAIWEGASHLAWKFDAGQKRFVNDGKFGGHFSLITGRRWNSGEKRCEYRVRNSFIAPRFAREWIPTPEKTGFWLRDDYLFQSINHFRYLVDEFGNP